MNNETVIWHRLTLSTSLVRIFREGTWVQEKGGSSSGPLHDLKRENPETFPKKFQPVML